MSEFADFLIGLIKIYLIGLFSKIEKKFYIYHSTIQQSNKDCIWTTEDSMCTSGKLNKTEVNSSTKTFKKTDYQAVKTIFCTTAIAYGLARPLPAIPSCSTCLTPADDPTALPVAYCRDCAWLRRALVCLGPGENRVILYPFPRSILH